jgi:hypothetical protein
VSVLLGQADLLLAGRLDVRAHSLRSACWLARTALEDAVRELLVAKGLDPGEGSMRSLLGCLEVAYRVDRPGLAMRAQYAWDGLSRAAHHHAFELSPTLAEVRHLTGLVGAVEAAAASGPAPHTSQRAES